MCVQSPIGLLKPHQLALLIKKSQDNTIGTQESDFKATLCYQYYNIHFSPISAVVAQSSIDKFKEMCIIYIIKKRLCQCPLSN